MTSKYSGMRNPLRRAYNQLSRLIINEGFKEFAKLCGFDTEDPNCAKDPKYQALKNAYGNIQSNDKLKKFYKAKMVKDGISISNLDQALYKASSSDESVSPIEKFLKDYESYSATYEQYFKDETEKRRLEKTSHDYLLRKQKDKDERLKEAFADNVVEDAEDYIVYEARTFEEANQMRWMWMGNVLKMSNEECKKLDPNAPADSQTYSKNMSAEEMAEYIMSNNEFIMNPSWCVCAGQEHWDNYACGANEDDEIAACHLVFSKKYPNARFCIVASNTSYIDSESEVKINVEEMSNGIYAFFLDDFSDRYIDYIQLEIRDPWQAGGFGGGNQKICYGLNVMKEIFGEQIVSISCIDEVLRVQNEIVNREEPTINDYTTGEEILNEIEYVDDLVEMKAFKQKLGGLRVSNDLFAETQLHAVNIELPELVDGNGMFENCENLEIVTITFPKLQRAKNMFSGCKLDAESVMNICENIPTFNGTPNHETGDGIIHIDCYRYNDDAWLEKVRKRFKEKGWTAIIK